MVKINSLVRLAAASYGQTKCVVFVDSVQAARLSLEPYLTTIEAAFPFINAFGASVGVHSLRDLEALPCVKAVAPHALVSVCSKTGEGDWAIKEPQITRPSLSYRTDRQSSDSQSHHQSSPPIAVAVIDTGLRPHMDFLVPQNRIVGFKDFINGKRLPYDDNGHGTAVSSILCGNGLCGGARYCGIAPKVHLYGLKAIGANGEGGAFSILEAMQWVFDNATRCNIRVVCMSFGAEPIVGGTDPLSVGSEALWKKGIVVVASAGNDGPKAGSIKSPGCSGAVITVGGAKIEENGNISVAEFSSRGPVLGHYKPDIIAPSVDIAAASLISHYDYFTGTSMAAPFVAGICANLLTENPQNSPDRIKEELLKRATKLPLSQDEAGWGVILNDN